MILCAENTEVFSCTKNRSTKPMHPRPKGTRLYGFCV